MKRIVQVTACLASGDGTGGIIFGLHKEAQRLGYDSQICAPIVDGMNYQEYRDSELNKLKTWVSEAKRTPTAFILHYGITEEIVDQFFLNLDVEIKCFYYHNHTPPQFFRGWNQEIEQKLLHVPHMMERILQKGSWLVTGDSYFNLSSLPKFEKNKLLRPVMPSSSLKVEGDSELPLSKINTSSSVPEYLFVGRYSFNKRQDVLLYALFALKKRGLPGRLTLIGKWSGPYLTYLQLLVKLLRLKDDVRILLNATSEELASAYSQASYFLVASEHEGFCVPVIEALEHHLIPLVRPYGALADLLKGSLAIAKGKSYQDFFDLIESRVSESFQNKEAYQRMLSDVRSNLNENLSSYQNREEFLQGLFDSVVQQRAGIESRSLILQKEEYHQRIGGSALFVFLDFFRNRIFLPVYHSIINIRSLLKA